MQLFGPSSGCSLMCSMVSLNGPFRMQRSSINANPISSHSTQFQSYLYQRPRYYQAKSKMRLRPTPLPPNPNTGSKIAAVSNGPASWSAVSSQYGCAPVYPHSVCSSNSCIRTKPAMLRKEMAHEMHPVALRDMHVIQFVP